MAKSISKVKSGAEKRKIRKEKEKELQKLPKLDIFLKKSKNDIHQSDNIDSADINEFLKTEESQTTDTATENAIQIEEANKKTEVETNIHPMALTNDLGKYLNQIISDDERRLLVRIPPHRPKGPFPKNYDQQNRSFSETYYYYTSKYGPVPRIWLCYSIILDTVYCESCWLFSNQNSQWKTGLKDWKNLSTRFFKLTGRSAKGITDEILRILSELNIPFEKWYGQDYDGASVMSGIYNGIQSKI
ncbi:zinc finger MYM-type protein 5-like [Hydra vulgaris]|uniref:Zinc finger MYM-type protein 5-like n=1 Tax=Hydra vulgaris TaxID=6087 RepID=A0ABM4BZX3_HYDVU